MRLLLAASEALSAAVQAQAEAILELKSRVDGAVKHDDVPVTHDAGCDPSLLREECASAGAAGPPAQAPIRPPPETPTFLPAADPMMMMMMMSRLAADRAEGAGGGTGHAALMQVLLTQ